jgi:hypothetical protein
LEAAIETDAAEIEFSGTLVELLEKFKKTDDVQIFFFAEYLVRKWMETF